MPSRTSSFTAASPSGPLAAMRSAISSALVSTSSGATTAFTRPRSYARWAVIGVPGERHLQGDAQRDPRPEERAAAGREQAALHLGQPELRLGRGDDHVAPEEQLEPAGHRGGVRSTDQRHGDVALRQAEERACRVVLAELRPATRGKGTQVHARGEGAVSRAGEHHGPDLRVGLGVDDHATDPADDLGGQGVARLGAIQAGDEHRSPLFAYQLVCHRVRLAEHLAVSTRGAHVMTDDLGTPYLRFERIGNVGCVAVDDEHPHGADGSGSRRRRVLRFSGWRPPRTAVRTGPYASEQWHLRSGRVVVG